MRNKIVLLLSLVLLASCEKNELGVTGEGLNNFSTELVLNKKGVCYTNTTKRWSHRTSELGAHWMYSWGNLVRDEIPENVEYVPMFWGASSVNEANLTRIKGLIDEGKVKYILGFNEPDGASQANMTVDQAIALWPQLESLGVPIVSPATVSPTNAWMKEFMEKADALGLRIDYIGVHSYGGPNYLSFISKLKETYELYGKRPLWVTEFAVADWTATTPAANKYTQEQVISFMTDACKAMDDIDWVFRYSWFDGTNAPLITSALYEADKTTLTPAGQVYANMNRNAIIGPGIDTETVVVPEPGELLVNGGFETGELVPFGGYNNGVSSFEVTTPFSGNFFGRILNGAGSIYYDLTVTPGTNYQLKFQSKWNATPTTSFSGAIRNNAGNLLIYSMPPMSTSTDWTQTTYNFVVPSGVTSIRVMFFKPSGGGFFLDNISLKII